MTFIYPRQYYSTSASGAEQTTEIKNPNWPETNQLALPSTHIWIGCGADISLVFFFLAGFTWTLRSPEIAAFAGVLSLVLASVVTLKGSE